MERTIEYSELERAIDDNRIASKWPGCASRSLHPTRNAGPLIDQWRSHKGEQLMDMRGLYLSNTWGLSAMKQSPISTDRFTWISNTHTFVAAASDLKDLVLWRVYEDACDAGFCFKSARTGKLEFLVETHNEMDDEGELIWSEFRALRNYPGTAVEEDWKVVIYFTC